MANSAGTKPHHILVIVAHLPMKGWCIGNFGVRSPFSNMKLVDLGPILMLLALEGYLVQFCCSINIDWYALLHPKLLESTFEVMTFNHPKMYEWHDRPPCVGLPYNMQTGNLTQTCTTPRQSAMIQQMQTIILTK